MRDDPSVIALVTRAAGDDQQAWDELIERYAPLVWATCTRYRLSNHDIEDVGQSVWLMLVAQLGKLRERPRCPAGWRPPPNGSASGSSRRPVNRSNCGARWMTRRSRTSGRSTRRSLSPSGTRRCGRPSPSFHRMASTCWPCSSVTRRARIPRSARRWGSRSGASARSVPVAQNGYGSHQLSPHSVRASFQSAVREAATVLDSWDDDQLLAALGDAVRARQAVPDAFVEMGKGAYA